MEGAVRLPTVLPNRRSSACSTLNDAAAAARGKAPLELEKLAYDVDAWSSYSAQYHPRNIMVDDPTDQLSRWSSGSNDQRQFVTLKLRAPAIVHCITLGKYHKQHVCNLKEFKVYGGMDKDHMAELLHGGLRNDSEPETFQLLQEARHARFACKYIQIRPLEPWGKHFNFSIWYVELRGVSEASRVAATMQHYHERREREAVRLCLKYLRRRNLAASFSALVAETGVRLEDPQLGLLYDLVVRQGNFRAAEDLCAQVAASGLFEKHVCSYPYTPLWRRVLPVDANGAPSEAAPHPGPRGGHQMCVDPARGVLYLFGGWDGTKDLADFWSFDTATMQWRLIASNTEIAGGPRARSCHKLCWDSRRRMIYVLGRYVEAQARVADNLKADFYAFDVDNEVWRLVCEDTAAVGGPELIFDHQMCIDEQDDALYVFGGRALGPAMNGQYAGLYVYRIAEDRWWLLLTDETQPPNAIRLVSRIGHSMVFNGTSRELYVIAGQRNKDYLSDFYAYNVDTGQVREVAHDCSKYGGPDAGFTQRATIDVALDELYLLSGLNREGSGAHEVKNSFFVYSIANDRWERVYQNENTGAEYWSRMRDVEPQPRFAHQLVYCPRTRLHFLFGGNPGTEDSVVRLDDLWCLELGRPTAVHVLRRMRFLLRRQAFREQCAAGEAVQALRYLQTELASCVDHGNPAESTEFRLLATEVFGAPADASAQFSRYALFDAGRAMGRAPAHHFHERSELFSDLIRHFPASMREPSHDLVDMLGL